MEIQKIFFGEQGLTETSANHIANVAKEVLRKDENDINSISFVHKQVSLINNPTRAELSLGMDEDDCRAISGKLDRIMKIKSLIAWLREAIKEKKRLHAEVEGDVSDRFYLEYGKEHPNPMENEEEDAKHKALTEETYLETLPINERCRIFSLKTQAATIGKVIHEKGAVAKAREELYNSKKSPTTVVKSGVNNLIYYSEPALDEEIVDEVYFALQKKYREIQAELNSYLNKQTEAIRESEIEYSRYIQQIEKDYEHWNKMYTAAWNEYSKKLHRDISHLKIVIPNQLREVYEEIQSVG